MRRNPLPWMLAALVGGVVAGGVTVSSWWEEPQPSNEAGAYAVLGGPKLERAYAAWTQAHEAGGGDQAVQLALNYSKALSASFTRAHGTAVIDLVDGKVEVDVVDLPAGEFDVWVVDNRPGPGASVRAEDSDVRVHVGRLERDGQRARLVAELGPDAFADLNVDLVSIAPAGAGPARGLLYGSLPLFQRIYSATRTPQRLMASDFAPGVTRPKGIDFGISVANAANVLVDPDVLFSTLVAAGAELFINETFQGNGRTCATCHPLGANTQLSVTDIESFPDDDPLFAAEFVPALIFTPGGPKFEVPILMRGAALITENQDGVDDLVNKFNLRSIPHTLALTTSLAPNLADGTTVPPNQRTGWSGDGAPNSGTLRDFATGAVFQHFTLRLNRVPNVDFRLPTDPELDAMEAFQLALGRNADLVLPLSFRNAIVARGQTVFTSPAARCNGCHSNASANVAAGTNRNFNTGVEDQVDRPTQLILAAAGIDLTPGDPNNLFPRDGGFGATPGNTTVGFGNGTFNTPPLVEAADTGPFFHDNTLRTLEGAVAFYNSTAFANSPAGTPAIDLQPTQIEAVAAFLRAINTLENIRGSRDLASAVAGLAPNQRTSLGPPLVQQAASEIDDAIGVLSSADLHPDAVADLRAARALIPANPSGNALLPSTMNNIIGFLDQAKSRILLP